MICEYGCDMFVWGVCDMLPWRVCPWGHALLMCVRYDPFMHAHAHHIHTQTNTHTHRMHTHIYICTHVHMTLYEYTYKYAYSHSYMCTWLLSIAEREGRGGRVGWGTLALSTTWYFWLTSFACHRRGGAIHMSHMNATSHIFTSRSSGATDMNESCNIWMSHLTYERVTSHVHNHESCHGYVSLVTRTHEWEFMSCVHASCHMYIWRSHVIYECVASHKNKVISQVYGSRHTYVWMSRVQYVNESYHTYTWKRHITYDWAMSHVWWVSHVKYEEVVL